MAGCYKPWMPLKCSLYFAEKHLDLDLAWQGGAVVSFLPVDLKLPCRKCFFKRFEISRWIQKFGQVADGSGAGWGGKTC